MHEPPNAFRLCRLPAAVKATLTAYLALVSLGYLVGTANIYFRHRENDLEPGLGPNDLVRHFHGLRKTVSARSEVPRRSPMLAQVEPGGGMRANLERGGEPAVRTLIRWLERGALEEEFARRGLVEPGDPSPEEVIRANCVSCHNAAGGDKSDVPFAERPDALPAYALVAKEAVAPAPEIREGSEEIYLPPIGIGRLVHVTHTHVFTIPTFVLAVAVLFFLSGVSPRAKAILGPIPILAVCLDLGSWWLARPIAAFAYAIAAAGAILAAALALQVLAILWSLWIERPEDG
ncbi:MAG: hypothetical protein ACUVYA_12350 [Planctomycetota bacterium]